jgi:hypothetical protein
MKDFRVLCTGAVAEMIANLGLKNGYEKDSSYDKNLPICLYLQFTHNSVNPVSVQWALDSTKGASNWMTVDAVIEMFKETTLRDVKPGQKFTRLYSSLTFRMLKTPSEWWDTRKFYQDVEDNESLYYDANLHTVVKIVE